MKKILIASVLILSASPSMACTKSQTESYNLAIRLMNTAVDISTHIGGASADKAVNSIMDLVAVIDRNTPKTCGK